MFSNDLENAYAYEMERRKDELSAAAQSRLQRESLKNYRSRSLPITVLSILAFLLANLFNH
jgi:hypothetical protein